MPASTVTEVSFADLGHVELRQVADTAGEPTGTEVALEPAYLGICGSDLHVLHGRHPWIRPPVVTGHEASATVAATGPEARRVRPGDRVLVNPLLHCGECAHCRRGAVNTCDRAQVLGFRAPGVARTRFTIDETFVHPLPARLPSEVAVLAEPLATGWHAVGRCTDLDDVLVVGGGSVGLSVLLALQARGAGSITIVEPSEAKRRLAHELGAAGAYSPAEAAGLASAHSTVIDCVATQETLDLAVRRAHNGGTVLVVGVPDAPREFNLPRMQRFEVDLRGSGLYLPTDIDDVLALLGNERIDPTPLVSAVHPLTDAPAAYEAAAQLNSIKVLVHIQ